MEVREKIEKEIGRKLLLGQHSDLMYFKNRLLGEILSLKLKLKEAEAQNKKLLALFECGVNSQDGFGNYIIDADEADEIIKEENKGCYKCGCTKVDWGDNLNHGGYATCKECGEPLTSK